MKIAVKKHYNWACVCNCLDELFFELLQTNANKYGTHSCFSLFCPKNIAHHIFVIYNMRFVEVNVVFNNVFDELPFSFTKRMVGLTWKVHQIFIIINMRKDKVCILSNGLKHLHQFINGASASIMSEK